MSWPIVPLGEVAEVRAGAPRRASARRPLPAGTDREATEPVPAGTVLFSSRRRIGGSTIAGAPTEIQPGAIGLIPGEGIEPRFLGWCLDHFKGQVGALAGPGVLGEISGDALGRFPIPLPPLAEQRRIAGVLDNVDRLRQLHAQLGASINRLLSALFLAHFGDPALNRKSWPTARLADLCDVVDAPTARDRARLNQAPPQGRGAGTEAGEAEPRSPLVTHRDLSSLGDWVLAEAPGTQLREAGRSRAASSPLRPFPLASGAGRGAGLATPDRAAGRRPGGPPWLPQSAVLVSSRPPIGRTAIAGTPVRIGQGVVGLVCGARLDPWYLFAWCRLRRRFLQSLGDVPRREPLSTQAVGEIKLPVPPVGEQRRFRSVLEQLRPLRLRAFAAGKRREDLARLLALRAFSRTVRKSEARDRFAHWGASPASRDEAPDRATIVENLRTVK